MVAHPLIDDAQLIERLGFAVGDLQLVINVARFLSFLKRRVQLVEVGVYFRLSHKNAGPLCAIRGALRKALVEVLQRIGILRQPAVVDSDGCQDIDTVIAVQHRQYFEINVERLLMIAFV